MNLLQHIAQSRHLLRKSELKVADHVPVSYTHLDVYKRQVLGLLVLGVVFLHARVVARLAQN